MSEVNPLIFIKIFCEPDYHVHEKILFISGTEIVKKKITGTRSSLGTTC